MARIWKDEIVERPRTFNKIDNPDGTITLEKAYGEIIQAGTPVNATNMNDIENRKAEAFLYTVELLVSNWVGEEPSTQEVTVADILETDTPIIDIVMSGDFATDEARQENWGHIYRAVTDNNKITFYAMEKPEVELPLQCKVVR